MHIIFVLISFVGGVSIRERIRCVLCRSNAVVVPQSEERLVRHLPQLGELTEEDLTLLDIYYPDMPPAMRARISVWRSKLQRGNTFNENETSRREELD